jgi:hypothetical protein
MSEEIATAIGDIAYWQGRAERAEADNAALLGIIRDWSTYHNRGEGKEEDALLDALSTPHPDAPARAPGCAPDSRAGVSRRLGRLQPADGAAGLRRVLGAASGCDRGAG